MNRFIIALIFGMLLATSLAFRMRTQTAVHQDDEDTEECEEASLTYPLARGERPMGHTEHTSEEYFMDCDPADQSGLDFYSCRENAENFEAKWKGVIYCARQNQYDFNDLQKIFDFQLSSVENNGIGAQACAIATTMFTTGFYDCDIYNTVADVVAHASEDNDNDFSENRILNIAEREIRNVMPSFSRNWCAPYTPNSANVMSEEDMQEMEEETGDEDDEEEVDEEIEDEVDEETVEEEEEIEEDTPIDE
jgi:hypothetical protein